MPILILVGLMFFLFKNAREAGQGIFSFAQSRARLFTKDAPQIKFTDVAGAEEAKRELAEVVDFLKSPKKYKDIGARTPKGVLLVGPPGVGKCVTGDTLVWTNKGLLEIQDIPKYYAVEDNGVIHGAKVASFIPENGTSSTMQASHWYDLGISETIHVKTNLGHSIEGTTEHPLVVVDSNGNLKFKRLDQVAKKDFLPLKLGDQMFGNYKKISVQQAYLLGLLTGDGGLTIKDRICFTTADKQLLDAFGSYFQDNHGYQIKKATGKYDVFVSSSLIKSQLINMGLSENYSRNKKVPEYIMMAPKEQVVAFLQGLFDTDGSVYKGKVEYCTSSGKLAKAISAQLINLGIMHKFRKKGTNQHSSAYILNISGQFLIPFYEQIGFRLQRKQDLLIKYLNNTKVRTNIDLVPNQGFRIKKVWRHLVESGKKPSLTISSPFHKDLLRYVKGQRKPSTATLRMFLVACEKIDPAITELKEFQELKAIAFSNLFFDQVKDIQCSEARVYDFTVPQTHSFIANGFVSHNTLLARAIAGEAAVPFFSIAGSEFMEMLVGVGASRVRDMFAQAKKAAPAIIFIDEIESIGRQRGMGFSGGHDEREQTLNQILIEMDGFTPNESTIVVAASVTGDTPILIKNKDDIKLLPIGEFIDQFYCDNEGSTEKSVVGIETLGFDRKINNRNDSRLYFQNSAFKKVRSVFRHRVKEVYLISYLGGKIKTTGNHSVFIRTSQGIVPKKVSELKQGDILVNIPLKANRTNKSQRELRFHKFQDDFSLTIPVYQNTTEDQEWEQKYIFAAENYGFLSEAKIASQIGVSQTTVGNWLRGMFLPRKISRHYFNHKLIERIDITPEFCRLLGYYVAEGYSRKGVDFCFNDQEKHLIRDLKSLMRFIFGLEPDRERQITDNAVNIIYYSKPIGDLFASYGGKGAKNKHVPSFLFQAPKEYFIEFLKGVLLGDGYIDKEGKGEITSISKQLILELNWLCRMHGIKSYIHSFTAKEGRIIKQGKPLAATIAYRLGFGKHNNPFISLSGGKDNPIKRPVVQKIEKIPFNGYVYDLCGVENEAFFGGESPILLHNTNRPDLLDAALIRPGRFDRRVVLGMPDLNERKAIIELHMKGKPFTKDVSTEKLARRTVGFSGADLANVLNEAAIMAAREGKTAIDNKDLEEAATKEKLGPQRKRMQSEHDRKLAAYHEAGHAIVGHSLPKVDPVHRISIVSRGMSGGHTMFPPTEDRFNESKSRLLEQITAALGGQAAEQMIFKDVSTGAASDIEVATSIARSMVTQYGMSSLGPISVVQRPMFGIWRGTDEGSDLSPKLHDAVDNEIKKIMDTCFKNAQDLLRKNKIKLDKVAKELLEKETLEGEEFESIVGKKKTL